MTGPVSNRIRPAFSLIEVLIAVLVLALGMLGLGAVFPAIIAEQRDSFEAVEGENAAASAVALLNNPEMVNLSLVSESFNKFDQDPEYRYENMWAVEEYSSSAYSLGSVHVPGFNFFTGLWSYDIYGNLFGGGGSDSINAGEIYQSQIPVSSRLFPQPYSGVEPKFVWDVALRRVPGDGQLQAAIFVRRVDARVRVPNDHSLSDVLTGGGGINAAETRIPVGIYNDFGNQSDPRNGAIAADAGPNDNVLYAVIQALRVEVHPERLDWLIFSDGRDDSVNTSVGLATQVGQKLVDNTGTVRTVVGVAQADSDAPLASYLDSARVVVVDPPFLPSNAGGTRTEQAYPGANSTDPEWDDERASWVRQVIFTPREPVAVKIVTIGGDS